MTTTPSRSSSINAAAGMVALNPPVRNPMAKWPFVTTDAVGLHAAIMALVEDYASARVAKLGWEGEKKAALKKALAAALAPQGEPAPTAAGCKHKCTDPCDCDESCLRSPPAQEAELVAATGTAEPTDDRKAFEAALRELSWFLPTGRYLRGYSDDRTAMAYSLWHIARAAAPSGVAQPVAQEVRPELTDAQVDRMLSAVVPGGSQARDWFLPHETAKGMANVRDVVRHMLAASLPRLLEQEEAERPLPAHSAASPTVDAQARPLELDAGGSRAE